MTARNKARNPGTIRGRVRQSNGRRLPYNEHLARRRLRAKRRRSQRAKARA